MRLDKFLTECGMGSRKEVKELLDKGLISLNGKRIKSPKEKVDFENDEVFFENKKLEYKKDRFYILYKIGGFVTATEDKKDRTVMELLPEWVNKKELFPVGRLDKDTEGVLLFTNNGKIAHDLLSPKKHVEKTYYVKLLEEIDEKSVNSLEEGISIGDYITKPAKVRIINNMEILLTISEGKFHQVKKMMLAIENKVVYLKRVKFGKMELGDMKPGEVREVLLTEII